MKLIIPLRYDSNHGGGRWCLINQSAWICHFGLRTFFKVRARSKGVQLVITDIKPRSKADVYEGRVMNYTGGTGTKRIYRRSWPRLDRYNVPTIKLFNERRGAWESTGLLSNASLPIAQAIRDIFGKRFTSGKSIKGARPLYVWVEHD